MLNIKSLQNFEKTEYHLLCCQMYHLVIRTLATLIPLLHYWEHQLIISVEGCRTCIIFRWKVRLWRPQMLGNSEFLSVTWPAPLTSLNFYYTFFLFYFLSFTYVYLFIYLLIFFRTRYCGLQEYLLCVFILTLRRAVWSILLLPLCGSFMHACIDR